MPKRASADNVREKIMRYCAYQERCHADVRRKLSELGVTGDEADEIIVSLIKDQFLNEERFARLFVHGKFRLKRWGRLKIIRELEMRGLTQACIRSGLQAIDEEEYIKTLEYLISRKRGEYREQNIFVKRDKIADYVIRKGFEPDMVWDVVKKLVPDRP